MPDVNISFILFRSALWNTFRTIPPPRVGKPDGIPITVRSEALAPPL
jgi:hypothetical protein